MAGVVRVWDRFLTDRDRAHLAHSRDRRVGFGQRPAVLLIDLYRAVFGDRSRPLLEAIDSWPQSCGPAAWEALPHIQRLLAAAREAGLPIVHVTMLTDSGMPGWSEAAHHTGGGRDSSHYEIIPELAPAPGEVVLRKSSPSAFWGTPLAGHLTHLGVDTLIVAGESTSGCVSASVV